MNLWIPTKFCDNGLSGTRIIIKNEKNNFIKGFIFYPKYFVSIPWPIINGPPCI